MLDRVAVSSKQGIRLVALLALATTGLANAEGASQNLIANGGFEQGAEGWSWGQWKGLPQPGFVDPAESHTGDACYVMGLTGVAGPRSLYASATIDPSKDYELRFALRGEDLPKGAVRVALLQWGTEKGGKAAPQGWVSLPGRPGQRDLLVTGGTFGWKEFAIHVYRQGIKPTTQRLTLYFDHTAIGTGELGIDDVSLVAVEPIEYKPPPPGRGEKRPPTATPAPVKVAEKPQPTLAPAPAKWEAPKELLIDRCGSTEGWELNVGAEFHGAQGGVARAEADGRGVLEVGFDLSAGGRYVGAQRRVEIRDTGTLVFEINSPAVSTFEARLWDTTDQVHQSGFRVKPGGWQRIELALTKEGLPRNWGGANDGVIHWPLRRVLIAALAANGPKGTFQLRDVALRTTTPAPTWRLDVTTDKPGHLHFVDERPVNVAVAIENRLREKRNVPVSATVVDLAGNEVASSTRKLSVDAWAEQTVPLSVESPGPGYFHVTVQVGEEADRQECEGAFGVVPRPARFRQRDADSFFAMHVSDPEAAARMGVHWSRYFHFWRYRELHPGKYTYATDYVKRCLDAGIDVMMLFDYREPSWLEPKTDADGLPTEDALKRYADFVRDAIRAHEGVAVFEIQNEPNLELWTHRNLPLEKGIEFYARLVETIAPIIRQESPDSLICGCCVSGGDYSNGFQYSRPVLQRVGKYLDVFGAHPYASPRTFGPFLRPAFPEDNREAEKHRAALQLLGEFDKPRQMWIGEKGWEIQDAAPLLGDVSLSFADCCARSLIIARSVPGIGKYFWFLQQHEYARGAKYALFRGSPTLQPMPGAVAYANVAHHLDHAKPVESLKLAGGSVQAHVFSRSDTKTAVAALWSVRGPFIMQAELPSGAQAFDLYGREVATQRLELTGTPTFIRATGGGPDGLLTAIKQAPLETGTPFEVVSASLTDVSTLRLGLINQTGETLPIRSRLDGQTKRLVLRAVTEPTWVDLGLGEPATQRNGEPLQLTLSAGEAKPTEATIPTDVLPVVRREDFAIDGDAKDWAGVPELVVDSQDRIMPPDPAGWRGPDDLSARATLAWDEERLYLLVRVTDDKHVTPNLQSFWDSDSLQVAVDVMNDASSEPGFDEDDREYGVVVDAKGAHTYRTHPATRPPEFRAAGKRVGTETIYEMAFPWSELGREPKPGMVFSLNFIANENDGNGRKYWMGLTPGIGEGKLPGLYRDFYLVEPTTR